MTLTVDPDAWFDEFWTELQEDEDDRISALRLIGQMFAAGVIERNGDQLFGAGAGSIELDAVDQYLIRRIEDAADAASGDS